MNGLILTKSIKNFLSVRTGKTVLTMLLLCSIIVNGFVPRTIENKKEISEIIGTVINNVTVKIIKDCRDTLTVMSNKITKNLYKLLRVGETGTSAPLSDKNKKEETPPVNTSSDNGVTAAKKKYEYYLNYDKKETKNLFVEIITTEKLYRLYNNIKEYCSTINKIGILFFVLFIFAVRTRKEDIAESLLNVIKLNKTGLHV